MNLPYSLYQYGKPTNFPEKILWGLYDRLMISESDFNEHLAMFHKVEPDYPTLEYDDLSEKVHTIRTDEKDRWKVGNKIHMVIHNRTKNRYQFTPVLEVKYIQDVFMTYKGYGGIEVTLDDTYLYHADINQLAINDGFDDRDHFENWFIPVIKSSENECFSGKIIHWTDLRY